MNFTTLSGHVVKDPEAIDSASGDRFCSFTLAVDQYNMDTMFIDCVAFKGVSEIVLNHCTKGTPAVVAGRLQSRKWEDKEGRKRTSYSVVCQSVMIGAKIRRDDADAPEPDYEPHGDDDGSSVGDDDVPF